MASAETFRVSGNGKKEVAEKRISEPHRDNRGLNSHLNASEVALAAITADGRLLTRALPATESSRMRRISPSLPPFFLLFLAHLPTNPCFSPHGENHARHETATYLSLQF